VTVGDFHESTIEVFDAFTLKDDGAAGALPEVTADTALDETEEPMALTALTLKQYLVPAFKPVTLKPRFTDAARLMVVNVAQSLATSIL
jgi:hypothetical protein